MNPDPFEALGLPARPDLPDEQVRAAWRAIAAATHPDRADGGDLARYTAASAAYAELRTPWGRSEAYADLLQQAELDGEAPTGPLPAIPADDTQSGALPRHPLAAVLGVPGPGPPRPPAPAAPARRHRRGAVPGGAAADPRHRRRPRRRRRADRVVRADRPPGPGTPARTVRKRPVPPAGPRAPGWTRGRVRPARRSAAEGGWGPSRPRRPGQAEHTARRPSRSFVRWGAPPGPAACGAHPCGWPTVTGWTSPRYGAAAPRETPRKLHVRAANRREQVNGHRKAREKTGKITGVIRLGYRRKGRVISYNVSEGERPGGIKVRFKIRIATGKRAREIDARQAKAIMEVLQWQRQHKPPS